MKHIIFIIVLVVGIGLFFSGGATFIGENYNYNTGQMERGRLDICQNHTLNYSWVCYNNVVVGGVMCLFGIIISMSSAALIP